MKTLKIFVVTLAMALYFTSAQADSDAVNNAQNLYGDGRVDSAISTLISYVEYGQVSDHKAYKLIATWSFEKGQYIRSARYYSMLLNSKNASVAKAMTSRSGVANQFKVKFNSAYQQGDTNKAITLAKATEMIELGFVRQAHYKYLARGKSATTYQKAIDNLKVAGKLASTYDEKRVVANRYIWMTQYHQNKANSLYAYAERLVGSGYVNGFKPRVETIKVLDELYVGTNPDDNGKIVEIRFQDFIGSELAQNGNQLFVKITSRYVPKEGDEVLVANGVWEKIHARGEYTMTFTKEIGRVYTKIWLASGAKAKVEAVVYKKVEPSFAQLTMN